MTPPEVPPFHVNAYSDHTSLYTQHAIYLDLPDLTGAEYAVCLVAVICRLAFNNISKRMRKARDCS